MFRMLNAMRWPLPTSPSRFAAGITQSVRISGQVDDPRMPSLCSSRPTVNPGIPFSTRKAVSFSSFVPGTAHFANTVKISAMPAFVIHIFSPFNVYVVPSAESTARVRAFIASEPEVDSDSAYAPTNSPVASFGRYFCFCSGVPYQTSGSVPIPTCAENTTQKLPCFAMFSATMADVTLSISRPPYSSGISTEQSPSSLASRIKRRVTTKSFASSASPTGTTSFIAKSRVVCAICRCSSVKSSGKKQSAAVASEIRNEPPGMRFVGVSDAVIVAMVLPLVVKMQLLRVSGHGASVFGQAARTTFLSTTEATSTGWTLHSPEEGIESIDGHRYCPNQSHAS